MSLRTFAMKINGSFESRFGAVAGAFERNFAERGEVGAAVCVYRRTPFRRS